MRFQFNVCGRKYECWEFSLPDDKKGSNLCNRKWLEQYLVEKSDSKQVFFFERHPSAFECILQFHLDGRYMIYRPESIPSDVFIMELEFFGIPRSVASCHYEAKFPNDPMTPIYDPDSNRASIWRRYLDQVQLTMDASVYSEETLSRRVYSSVFQLLGIISCCLPVFFLDGSKCGVMEKHNRVALALDIVIASLFVLDITARLVLALVVLVDRLPFTIPPQTSILIPDLIALSAQLSTMITYRRQCMIAPRSSTFPSPLFAINSLRLLRMYRYSVVLKCYRKAMLASASEIFISISSIAGFVLVSGMLSMCQSTDIRSKADDCMWWAASTLTGVGFGDIVSDNRNLFSIAVTVLVTSIGSVLVTLPAVLVFIHYNSVCISYQKCQRRLL